MIYRRIDIFSNALVLKPCLLLYLFLSLPLSNMPVAAFDAGLKNLDQTSRKSSDRTKPVAIEQPLSLTREQIQASFSSVVDAVAPAVVNIFADKKVRTARASPFSNDPIFNHFFGGPSQTSPSRIQSSLGSGVIVDPQGIAITNYHVIKGAEKIKVVMHNGTEYAAKVMVHDKRTDLAALKLTAPEKKRFSYLSLRDADDLKVGDIVLAFGNPFGFGNTVTSGIISGLARSQLGASDFRSFIQTDAAINPGNSGGPLVTLDGRLVGINTAIFSNTGGSIGIGFAIPSNLVAPVLTSVSNGSTRVVRPWLGLQVSVIDPDRSRIIGNNFNHGVKVNSIYEGGSAAQSGIREGDILIKIGAYDVTSESSMRFRFATLPVGSEVPVTLFRSGKQQIVMVKLVAPPELKDNRRVKISGRNPLSGAAITGLSPLVAEDTGLPYGSGGILIFKVDPGTFAQLNGFRFGDVITAINNRPVRTIEDFEAAMRQSKRTWRFEFSRDGIRQVYELQL